MEAACLRAHHGFPMPARLGSPLEGAETGFQENLAQAALIAEFGRRDNVRDEHAARTQHAAETLQDVKKIRLAPDVRRNQNIGIAFRRVRPAIGRLTGDLRKPALDQCDEKIELIGAGDQDLVRRMSARRRDELSGKVAGDWTYPLVRIKRVAHISAPGPREPQCC